MPERAADCMSVRSMIILLRSVTTTSPMIIAGAIKANSIAATPERSRNRLRSFVITLMASSLYDLDRAAEGDVLDARAGTVRGKIGAAAEFHRRGDDLRAAVAAREIAQDFDVLLGKIERPDQARIGGAVEFVQGAGAVAVA